MSFVKAAKTPQEIDYCHRLAEREEAKLPAGQEGVREILHSLGRGCQRQSGAGGTEAGERRDGYSQSCPLPPPSDLGGTSQP